MGYKDDGTICGIENEIPELNTSEEDNYQYKPTLDGLELKIRNTIKWHLGGFANSMTKIEFRKTRKTHGLPHRSSGIFKTHLPERSLPVQAVRQYVPVSEGR